MPRKKPSASEHEARVRSIASCLALTRSEQDAVDYCVCQYGTTLSEARKLAQEARAQLALAADVDVRYEFGKRKEQLEDLRERARQAGDLRTELAALQETSKLCDLYNSTTAIDAASSAESATVALARKHLEALDVAPKNLPIEELARLVAEAFVRATIERDVATSSGKKRAPR